MAIEEEGHAADAEKSARQAMNDFRNQHQPDDELTAAAILIESLLAQGRSTEAKAAADGEAEVMAISQNQPVRFKFAIVAARAIAASGKLPEAKATNLKTLLQRRTQTGFSRL